MSHELLVKEALRRQEIFKNLNKYLRIIKSTVEKLDENAEVYLFGSVAEGKHLYSSDIDVLVVTVLDPAVVISELWKRGIKDPFEIHVCHPKNLALYRLRAKLVKF